MIKPALTVLIEGYAHPGENDTYIACSTSTLLQFDSKNYLVDPGCSGPLLRERLGKLSLIPEDINAIFISHYHLDHTLNLRLFPYVPVYDGSMQWNEDEEIPFTGHWLLPEFQVFATPGHADEQFSLLVDTENFGLVCIAQDVFWWEDGKQKDKTVKALLSQKDPFAADVTALQKSRESVLKSGAKWIIPGHGKMFKNPTLSL